VIRGVGGLDSQLGEQLAEDLAQRVVTPVASPVVRPGELAVQLLSLAGRQEFEHPRPHPGDLMVCIALRIPGMAEIFLRPGQ
jgi:hypothetical protein